MLMKIAHHNDGKEKWESHTCYLFNDSDVYHEFDITNIEEIKALEFVKKAREEARELDKKTDQEREATELSKIERYEQGIAEKKEKQKKLQEELNILRGAEEKDIDAIDRKEGELEEVSKKIVELEQKKQRSENNLGRIHERMENAKMSTTSSSGGGILSPIINLLSEIRDMLSKISGVPTKSGGDTSGSSPRSGGKTKSEINSMLSKYWQKKNGKSATKEEWEQLKKDYVDGKLTDLDEVLAQEVQAKIEKEKKEDSKPVTKNADTKKSDERFSNILRLAGFRDENNKAIEAKTTNEQKAQAEKAQLEIIKVQNEQKINTAEAEAKVRELQSQSVTEKSLEQLKLEIQREMIQKWNRYSTSVYARRKC